MPDDLDEERIRTALRQAWSPLTARQWTPQNKALGQCNVTALVIHARFGDEILKTRLPVGPHFYNRIDERRFDFTDDQFTTPVRYDDIPSGREEARRGVTDAELAALTVAFDDYYGPGR
jgi:hypothetical protein